MFADDGSLTISVQKDSPGVDNEDNWLPAPDGPFYIVMRIYLPEAETLNGTWKNPDLVPTMSQLESPEPVDDPTAQMV